MLEQHQRAEILSADGGGDAAAPIETNDASIGDAVSPTEASATVVDPRSLGELVVWLDPGRGVELSGANVVKWRDQSGSGRGHDFEDYAAAPSGTVVPFSPQASGRPSLRFQGSRLLDNGLQLAVGTVAFAFHKPADTGVSFGSNVAGYMAFREQVTPPRFLWTGKHGYLTVPVTEMTGTHYALMTMDANTGNVSLRMDDAPPATANFAGGFLSGVSVPADTTGESGRYGEIFVYSDVLSESAQKSILQYLQSRYPR